MKSAKTLIVRIHGLQWLVWTLEYGRQAVRMSVRIQKDNNALLLNNVTVGTKEAF
jgi:hypothetical protein